MKPSEREYTEAALYKLKRRRADTLIGKKQVFLNSEEFEKENTQTTYNNGRSMCNLTLPVELMLMVNNSSLFLVDQS